LYEEITVDPVVAGWPQGMIDNPEAKYCFVFMSTNALGKPTVSTKVVLANIISDAIGEFCDPYSVDTWYYGPKDGEYEHKLFTSSDTWVVVMRMMKETGAGFYNLLLRKTVRVEVRNV
jgi:hypothetical protein